MVFEKASRVGAKDLIETMSGENLTLEQISASCEKAGKALDKARTNFFRTLVKNVIDSRGARTTPDLEKRATAYDEAHMRWASWIRISDKYHESKGGIPGMDRYEYLMRPPVGDVEKYVENLGKLEKGDSE